MNRDMLHAMQEALEMALRALTTNLPAEEVTLTAAVVKFRIGQLNRELARVSCAV